MRTDREASDFELEERIQRYRNTTDAQRALPAVARATGYAAASASALALAGGANAAVIYSGIQNITLQTTPKLNPFVVQTDIDIDGAFGDDVRLRLFWYTYSRVSGGAYSTYFFYTNAASAGLFQHQLPNGAGVLQNGSSHALRLSSGATISSGAAFAAGVERLNYYTEFNAPQYGGGGTWPASGTGIVGLAINRGGNTHYGWLRLQLEDLASANGGPEGASDKITAVDWAYDSVAGRAILAGATVPEPSSFTMLAAGAAGLAAWRRRRRAQRARARSTD